MCKNKLSSMSETLPESMDIVADLISDPSEPDLLSLRISTCLELIFGKRIAVLTAQDSKTKSILKKMGKKSHMTTSLAKCLSKSDFQFQRIDTTQKLELLLNQ